MEIFRNCWGKSKLTHTLENNLALSHKVKQFYTLWPRNFKLGVDFRGTLVHVF